MAYQPNLLMIQRCLDLARQGTGNVSPNPVVGAVLELDGQILGEGYHAKYGQAHAEVNAFASVLPQHQHLLSKATLYVSLEPCNIHGRTPPCTDLILKHRVARVVAGAADETPGVQGSGLQRLRDAGIEVITQDWGQALASSRNTFVQQKRPYVILKWAQTLDAKIGLPEQQVWISNPYTQYYTHQWRSECGLVLAGSQTARVDRPRLNNRLMPGAQPIRGILDRKGETFTLPSFFTADLPTWVFSEQKPLHPLPGTETIPLPAEDSPIEALMDICFQRGINTILVEGGATLLQAFMDRKCWDEARVFTNPAMVLPDGIPAPTFKTRVQQNEPLKIHDNILNIWFPAR